MLLPSLHLLYASQSLPGLLVDGGANVGRATGRWIAGLGDTFARRLEGGAGGAVCGTGGPPKVFVVAVEPSARNFQLLERHAEQQGWRNEGFVAIQAALAERRGRAQLAVTESFAIDEALAHVVFWSVYTAWKPFDTYFKDE